jgi:uncharacterized membrane protein
MNLHRKLAEWHERGLIDAQARSRIEAYERQHQQPIWLYALGGLGGLTIATGLVSLVAANWEAIGRPTKLGLDLVLGACLAAGLYLAVRNGKVWQADLLTAVYYGFTLASIALLGQVYQLGSPMVHGLWAWSLCTLPLFLFVRGRYVALLWLAGLVWTDCASCIALLQYLGEHGYAEARLERLSVLLGFASLSVFLLGARSDWLVRERPQVSAAWSGALWSSLVLAAFVAAGIFYATPDGHPTFDLSLGLSGVLALALAWQVPRLYPEQSAHVHHGMRALLAFLWLCFALGLAFPRDDLPALAAILQVVALGLASYTVLGLGRAGMFNLLTALIGVRIIVMYFEVFGSMLDTGLGLVTGGVLTVLLAWFWKRKSPSFAARLSDGGDHAS